MCRSATIYGFAVHIFVTEGMTLPGYFHRVSKTYVAWWFYAMASVAHAAPGPQAPVEQNIQLGD